MSIATEIVTMKTSQEVTKDSFISIMDSLEKDYHSKPVSYTHLDVYKRQILYPRRGTRGASSSV